MVLLIELICGIFADYNLFCVEGQNLRSWKMESANNYGNGGEDKLRPVVALGQDIVVTTNSEPNSSTNMWQLSKK